MKIFGHAKVLKMDKVKVKDKDGYKGVLAWQKPKENKEDSLEFIELPFLVMGKSGESLDKYRNDKNGNARYFLITGDLKKGKDAIYIHFSSWDFPPYEPRTSDSGGDGGGSAPPVEEDPFG